MLYKDSFNVLSFLKNKRVYFVGCHFCLRKLRLGLPSPKMNKSCIFSTNAEQFKDTFLNRGFYGENLN